ncbi:hypothetical protein [Paraburkholderia sacchari]|uniref:Uncharacterized protein n=1 Tax=Paraburkholderia sacchari TaxID=159450 RepID=A0A8T6ZG19_9BURK|nr:hypothetical protein [Paraburkholderia sacchari]NLP63443.1 hypothetical protein [Paraburkholderia sacchari]
MRVELDIDLVAMLLRDQPPCTSAEISNIAAVFLDGDALAWADLNEAGHVEKRFALTLD